VRATANQTACNFSEINYAPPPPKNYSSRRHAGKENGESFSEIYFLALTVTNHGQARTRKPWRRTAVQKQAGIHSPNFENAAICQKNGRAAYTNQRGPFDPSFDPIPARRRGGETTASKQVTSEFCGARTTQLNYNARHSNFKCQSLGTKETNTND
jgi:hypothetical protein